MENNIEHITRVAIYTRVSSAEQAEKGTSLESQAEQLETFCKAQKWEVFNQYTDPGFSGKDGNRPALQALRRDAKAGYFEKVIVWRLDRLSRNLRLILEIEAELKEHDVSLFSIREMVDTSTHIGRTVFQVLGLTAEWERDNITERTKTGQLQRMKEGHWATGPAPYGFDYNKDIKNLVINESEAEIVRKIYNLYASGKSLGSIATQLNNELVRPRSKTGKGWHPTGIRQVLINPAYKGEALVNRHCHISDINKVDLSKVIKLVVPPIVLEDKWNIAQSRLINNKSSKATEDGVFTLQGMIKCGICGCSYRTDRTHGYRYYLCRGELKRFHIDGSPRCKNRSIRANNLEQAVWRRVSDIINDPNKLKPMLIEAIDKLRERESSLEFRLLPIEQHLKDIAERKSRLVDKFVIENMDTEKYKVAQQALEKEETRFLSLRRDVDPNQLAELESTRGLLKMWQKYVDSVDESRDTILKFQRVGSRELSELLGFPTTPQELFDKLQLRLVVFSDKIEVKAVFSMPDILNQECTVAEY